MEGVLNGDDEIKRNEQKIIKKILSWQASIKISSFFSQLVQFS